MSNWFDILYGAKESVPAEPVAAARGSGDQTGAQPLFETDAHDPPAEPLPKLDVTPVAPLPKMPARWVLELQKAAFHLTREGVAGGTGSPVVAFSGMQRLGGTSTISYLIAHYLAFDAPDTRILYVDFCLDKNRVSKYKAHSTLCIGQPLSDDLFRVNPKAFTKLSVRPGGAGAGTNSSKWFRDLFELSKRHCDWIVVDLPPFFTAPESYTIAQLCDGVVLVLKSGETRHPALNGLVVDLEQVGIRVLGTILNFRQYPIPRWLLNYI